MNTVLKSIFDAEFSEIDKFYLRSDLVGVFPFFLFLAARA